MQLTITKHIGRRRYDFTCQGNDLHEVVLETERLSFPDVPACGLCKSDDLILTARVAQDKFKYVSIKCCKCKADLTFGKMQRDDRTYFLRRTETGALDWRPYTPEGQEPAAAPEPAENYAFVPATVEQVEHIKRLVKHDKVTPAERAKQQLRFNHAGYDHQCAQDDIMYWTQQLQKRQQAPVNAAA
ncbi:hypothetical protein LJ737_04395 [Hymenobacter sp. 15J16-1T3B]|uniref:hypothetical protein n=1 Tax=Hymenobacter sp. 15J16-1T3B TaxID=2886941 RepID=UPI001D12860D|nr:hypothetical protein [Hymenobacter sp. 15J16-1T3B]MCC3156463.1 hypothetical protein [Hymenobacter sp. 15J16-1T3B]